MSDPPVGLDGCESSSPSKRGLGIPKFDDEYIKQVFVEQRLFVLGGLTKAEREALEFDYNGHIRCTSSRVAMAEGWFMRRLIARQKYEQGESASTSPPILSRLYQVISDGTLQFSHAAKIAETPFPFPYHNLISILLWSYTLLAPILINGLLMEDGLRAVIAFSAVFVYHALNNIGDNLEDPYQPYDPNELPLPEIQDIVNKKLLAFGTVPEAYDSKPVHLNSVASELAPKVESASEIAPAVDKEPKVDPIPKENGCAPTEGLPPRKMSSSQHTNGNSPDMIGNGGNSAEVVGKIALQLPDAPTLPNREIPSSETLRDEPPPSQKWIMRI
jgi:hypothetical protein